MSLPNKCPRCSMIVEAENEPSGIDPAKELEMRVGNRPVKEFYSTQPLYMPNEHGAVKFRMVACANCGMVYVKAVEPTTLEAAATDLPPKEFPKAPVHKSGKEE
jgi:hypothetical protein